MTTSFQTSGFIGPLAPSAYGIKNDDVEVEITEDLLFSNKGNEAKIEELNEKAIRESEQMAKEGQGAGDSQPTKEAGGVDEDEFESTPRFKEIVD